MLNDPRIGQIRESRKGKNISFDVPRKHGAFANAPKGPSILEVEQATFEAQKEKRLENILTRVETWFNPNDAGYMLLTPSGGLTF